jgi:hypothetical protein
MIPHTHNDGRRYQEAGESPVRSRHCNRGANPNR